MSPVFRKYNLLFIYLLVNIFCTYGQKHKDTIPSIRLISKAYQDSIVLRWAPSSAVTWTYANKYGYLIEKYTLLKDSVLVKKPVRITITHKALKPLALENWESRAEKDKYAGIAAQAIFGETFELTENYSSDIVQVIHKARELETRYSFALFSADMSPWVAKASALRYTDTNVKKGESYLYRIYTAVPESIEKIDTGFVYIGVDDYEPLPKPLGLDATFSDKTVLLRWDKFYYENIYNAYIVERSDDNSNTFSSIDELPLINTESNNKKQTEFMFKMDSLPQNDKVYYYRIKGMDAFGEIGPPSDTIQGMGVQELSSFPVIKKAEIINDKSVILTWDFPERFNKELKGFTVEHTGNASQPYNLLTKDTLPPETRVFEDLSPLTSNYYKIKAFGKFKQQAESYPYLVQLADSIPPAQPKILEGKIDTLGIVTLSWQENTEVDLLGYRVYRSNFKDEDFIQMTNKATPINEYTDSINIKTLTKSIFYKIIAVDFRENPSAFSEELKLKRPDIIPPVQPIFKIVRSEKEGIYLEWINSSSIDVTKHLLYRKSIEEKNWELITMFYQEDSVQQYTDNQVVKGKKYEYTLIAVDDGKLESNPAKPVTMSYIDDGIKPPIEKFFAKANRDNKEIILRWNYSYEGVKRFIIYKAMEDKPIQTYKSVTAAETKFIDKSLKVNSIYTYRIKAEFKNGSQSPFSKEFVVKY